MSFTRAVYRSVASGLAPTRYTVTSHITRLRYRPTLTRPVLLGTSSMIGFLSSFLSSSSSSASSKNMANYPEKRTDAEWRAVLSPEQFRILRQKGTERAFTGEYDKHMPESGVYQCAGCSAPLYKASHKFKSGCGWPAYFDCIPGAVKRLEDRSFGISRTEIVCSNCGGHLGHVFKGEGYGTPTDERHCVNSISLKFNEDEGAAKTSKENIQVKNPSCSHVIS
ncbi:methionine-R-sulfoxide reductase [Trichophyton rubrum D6]|uniref:Peptide-methionine (R)-S-oxide reductase n=4 Tax=Trichophyton TaxID=5550 RepID=F2SDC9_TRIRC|nr:methionine-R-sulfoxide reductase [Trichophyton rubrum CBS 118892]EZF11392.1 methionine-R-sulfoxide reductase [Trichophyton rubrum MR850]EZF38350.1 methionine-R-sulfoxide reductase [Trichophyton rubrum CBS 100081]EZF48973.1 methionine-R-sulfoxide reductase [Trichophyton rubrum CBS 288.86]EZF59651.1 methionine-R-sulfoxide reductase [Trichophyton rubrum CBS 289.86]EZF80911.1 methionine-R-sulfoxide reductase [Trichophyton rubrum MR1448]EZF91592.1 methionine-R-sulfoxide reductase [Trichophyton 